LIAGRSKAAARARDREHLLPVRREEQPEAQRRCDRRRRRSASPPIRPRALARETIVAMGLRGIMSRRRDRRDEPTDSCTYTLRSCRQRIDGLRDPSVRIRVFSPTC
jgi:hypothetical protein